MKSKKAIKIEPEKEDRLPLPKITTEGHSIDATIADTRIRSLLLTRTKPFETFHIELVRNQVEHMVDLRLIDLTMIMSAELQRVKLNDVLDKVRDMKTWKTYVITCEAGKVLGGCVLREHLSLKEGEAPLAELCLLAIDS